MSSRLFRPVVAATFIMCSTVASAGQQEPTATPELPDFLVEALAREGELQIERQVSALKGLVRTRVPAQLIASESYEGYDYLQFASGGNFPFECYFYETPVDVGHLLSQGSNTFIGLLAKQLGGEQSREIQTIDAGMAGEVPYLAAEWWFTTGEKDRPKIGSLKVVAAAPQDIGVLCTHGDLGYRESFQAVVTSVLKSLERTSDAPRPNLFREVSLITIQGLQVGYADQTVNVDDEGDFSTVVELAMAVPLDSRSLSSTDSVTVEWTNPYGALINRTAVESENGVVTQNLELFQDAEGTWFVTGTFQGKDLEASFEAPALFGVLGELLSVRGILLQEGQGGEEPGDSAGNAERTSAVEIMSWYPDADPTTATTMTFERIEETNSFRLSGAGPAGTFEADEFGNILRLEMEGIPMRIERVYSNGQQAFDQALVEAVTQQMDAAAAQPDLSPNSGSEAESEAESEVESEVESDSDGALESRQDGSSEQNGQNGSPPVAPRR